MIVRVELKVGLSCWYRSHFQTQKTFPLYFFKKNLFKQSPAQQFKLSVAPEGAGMERTFSHTCCQVTQPAASCALALHSPPPPATLSLLGSPRALGT